MDEEWIEDNDCEYCECCVICPVDYGEKCIKEGEE